MKMFGVCSFWHVVRYTSIAARAPDPSCHGFELESWDLKRFPDLIDLKKTGVNLLMPVFLKVLIFQEVLADRIFSSSFNSGLMQFENKSSL